MAKLREEVEARLSQNQSPGQIRTALIEAGYAEQDVSEALKKEASSHFSELEHRDRKNARLLGIHQFFDRVGFGAAAPQFINILFYMTGASLFALGLFNGLKTILSSLITSILQEYAHLHRISKNFVSAAGVLFGFSFLLMAFALRTKTAPLFATGFLLATLGVVTYGDMYNKYILETIRREKMSKFLLKIGQYGLLITMVAMLFSGWLMDRFPETSKEISILGFPVIPIGYLLSFEITAFAFIISGYLLSFIQEQRTERSYPLFKFVREHYNALYEHTGQFLKNKYTLLLIAATVLTGVMEVLGHSYYGLFIFQSFKGSAFGGFLNVAVLYSFAILASFAGPWFTRKVQRSIGLSPTLVFGTLLMAILPLTLIYNRTMFAVGLALIFSVIGSAILGMGQGLLARKLMKEEVRKRYFMSTGILIIIPYLLLVPVGSYIAQHHGMEALFRLVGFGLVIVVMPLYFILVAMSNKQRL